MKKKLNIVLAALGVVLVTGLLLTQAAWSEGKSQSFKLEGAWIAKVPGLPMQWSYNLSPDPSGRRASMSGSIQVPIKPVMINPALFPDWEYNSPLVGELVMTGPDTGIFSAVWYGLKQGPPNGFDQVVLIGVNSGHVKFTGPGKSEVTHHLGLYAPSTDVDGDGLPDPGQSPAVCLPTTTIDTRLPFLPPCTPTP